MCTYVYIILGQTNSGFNVQSYLEKRDTYHRARKMLVSLSSLRIYTVCLVIAKSGQM